MVRWNALSPMRRQLLENLVTEFSRLYGKGRTVLAVDGPGGAGTSTFADHLAAAFERKGHAAFRASIDGFHRPREERYRAGRFSAEGYYRDAFDYSVFRRVLIEPFRLGGSTGFVLEAFDLDRDAALEPKWITGPPDAVLIVDGVFLHRRELRDLWNWSIWLDAEPEVRADRLRERDDLEPGSELARRYEDAQRLYVGQAAPNAAASAIVDNTDPDAPKRRYADYCTVPPAPMP